MWRVLYLQKMSDEDEKEKKKGKKGDILCSALSIYGLCIGNINFQSTLSLRC
ncbi:MAG: hypothetical protein ACP5FK_03095 [bacterium]